jgi:hypothetical protein
VDFEVFRPELNAALSYTDRTEGGQPPFDPVLMFKILVIQATNNLSDERAEFLINDRLSFMRFLGLGLEDRVPDARTRLEDGEAITEHTWVDIGSSFLPPIEMPRSVRSVFIDFTTVKSQPIGALLPQPFSALDKRYRLRAGPPSPEIFFVSWKLSATTSI